VKKPEHEDDYSPPSIGEVKMGGDFPPLPYTSSWRAFKHFAPCSAEVKKSGALLENILRDEIIS
jgi:hypothetical protein